MNKSFAGFFFLICISLLLIFVYFIGKGFYIPRKLNITTITDIQNGGLCKLLTRDNIVELAGVKILDDGHVNYRKGMLEEIKKYLLNRKVNYKIIDRESLYPDHDLILAYLSDGTFVNKYLVINGMALYDQRYFPGNGKFYELQKIAQQNKSGMWGGDNPPKVLYVALKNSDLLHFVECNQFDYTKKNKEKLDFFYFEPEYTTRGRTLAYRAGACRECKRLANEKEAAPK